MKSRSTLSPTGKAENAIAAAFFALLIAPVASGIPLHHDVPLAEAVNRERPSDPPEQIYGTWMAKGVDAKMGEVKIRLTFLRENKATLLAWSDIPFIGKVRDLKGPFSVQGDTISSEAIRDGKKAKFTLKGDQLVLYFESGKIIRFDRE